MVVAAKAGKKGKGRAAKKSPTSVAAFADFDDAPPSPQYFGLRGPPQKILDEKPGRFVFRFNLVNKTMTLVDTDLEGQANPSKRVRFAPENEIAYSK